MKRHTGDPRKRKKTEKVAADVRQWQREHIRKGLRQADAGEFATAAEVAAVFARRR